MSQSTEAANVVEVQPVPRVTSSRGTIIAVGAAVITLIMGLGLGYLLGTTQHRAPLQRQAFQQRSQHQAMREYRHGMRQDTAKPAPTAPTQPAPTQPSTQQ